MHEVVCFSEMTVVIVPLSLENILETINMEELSLDGINPSTKKMNRYIKCQGLRLIGIDLNPGCSLESTAADWHR